MMKIGRPLAPDSPQQPEPGNEKQTRRIYSSKSINIIYNTRLMRTSRLSNGDNRGAFRHDPSPLRHFLHTPESTTYRDPSPHPNNLICNEAEPANDPPQQYTGPRHKGARPYLQSLFSSFGHTI